MKLKLTLAITAIAFLILFIYLDKLTPYRYDEINLDKRFLPPSLEHILGTDALGRDVFTRIIHGLKLSLTLSILSIALSSVLGSTLGILSALSKQFREVLDLLFNFFYVVPSIFIATLTAFITGSGVHVVVIAIVLRLFPTFYRIIKTVALTIYVQPYVEATKALGASLPYILMNHIVREALRVIAILSIYSLPDALSIELSVNFLGLGIKPPTPSLGGILAENINYITIAPHIVVSLIAIVFIIVFIAEIIVEKIDGCLMNGMTCKTYI
ncbi:MAG: ABC transporter permease [Sulfolobales archaeon]